MDIIATALPKPKIIDLSKHNSLSDAILMAYMQGGSSQQIQGDYTSLFAELDTEKSIRVVLPTQNLGLPYTIKTDEVTVVRSSTRAEMLAFNFMMYYDSTLAAIKVVINNVDDGILLKVVVESVSA